MLFVVGLRGTTVVLALVTSMVHAAGTVPQQAQARQVLQRVERDVVRDNYTDLYAVSAASLDMSLAAYLARIPHKKPPQGTTITIDETGPWSIMTLSNGDAILTQPIRIGVRSPGVTAQSWRSEIRLDYLRRTHRWYFQG